MPCKQCPENSECRGGKLVIPDSGYYRVSLKSEVSVACHSPEACAGGDLSNLLGRCNNGY